MPQYRQSLKLIYIFLHSVLSMLIWAEVKVGSTTYLFILACFSWYMPLVFFFYRLFVLATFIFDAASLLVVSKIDRLGIRACFLLRTSLLLLFVTDLHTKYCFCVS